MKIRPKKAALIGLASSVLFSSAGCEEKNKDTTETTQTIMTTENEPVAVYGPPEDFTERLTVDNNDMPTVYGPPSSMTEAPTVDQNELPDVYGPPEDF